MIGTKICPKCKIEKSLEDFYKSSKRSDGVQVECKECQKKRHKKYYQEHSLEMQNQHKKYYLNNKKYISEHQKKYYRDNITKIKNNHKIYREKNRELIRLNAKNKRRENIEEARKRQRDYQRKNRDKVAKWQKAYRESHKKEIAEYSKTYALNNREKINKSRIERLHNDGNFKLKEQTRNMIRCALRTKGHRKNSHTKDIVGCDLDFLTKYLFETWENRYGKKWSGESFHIDHIIPMSTAKSEEEVIKLCHYTNLQLLTPEDNMEKRDKLNWTK